jgi:hypothetical protein
MFVTALLSVLVLAALITLVWALSRSRVDETERFNRARSITSTWAAPDTAVLDTALLNTAPLDTAPLDTAPLDTAPLDAAQLGTAPLGTAPLGTAARGSIIRSDGASADQDAPTQV